MENDGELLRRYVEAGSGAAFNQLVRRHLDFVYGTALRMTRRPHRAEDVAQTVFTLLCRKARALRSRSDLMGWLYVSTHYAAKQLVRQEVRREAREQAAAATLDPDTPPIEWTEIAPYADEALRALRPRDREAILLRFFKEASYAEVGSAMGLSENAARMRVERALEKLRRTLRRHGIVSTATALELAFAAQPAAAAPAGLGASVATAALASAPYASAGLAAATLTFMSTSKFAFSLAALVLVGGTAATLCERQQRLASEARLTAALDDRNALRTQVAQLKASAASVRSVDTSAPTGGPIARGNPTVRTMPASNSDGDRIAAIAAAVKDAPGGAAAMAKLHEKYDAFLTQRGLSPDQAEQWLELMLAKDQARADVQAAVREQGITAGPKVQQLQSEATRPFWDGMHTLLGDDGYRAFSDYEMTYGYRKYVVPELQQTLSAANLPLNDQQSDSLAHIISQNQLLTKANPSDLGDRARTNWAAVLQQSGALLSAQQIAVLQSRLENHQLPH